MFFSPVSERDVDELKSKLISVNMNGSCYSEFTCFYGPVGLVHTCRVYCGTSIASLERIDSQPFLSVASIIVRGSPAPAAEYHCIVSGINKDGSTLYRAKATQRKSGEI